MFVLNFQISVPCPRSDHSVKVLFGGAGHHVQHGFGFLAVALEEQQHVLEVYVLQAAIFCETLPVPLFSFKFFLAVWIAAVCCVSVTIKDRGSSNALFGQIAWSAAAYTWALAYA